jgi:hypothetical protein
MATTFTGTRPKGQLLPEEARFHGKNVWRTVEALFPGALALYPQSSEIHMAEPRIVDFNALPKAVRERLVGCVEHAALPRPLLAEVSSSRGAAFGFAVLFLFGCAVVALTALFRFGQAVQGPFAMAGYAVGIALAILGVLAMIRRSKLASVLPFAPGRYLFPVDFVDARSRMLRLVPLCALIDIRSVPWQQKGVEGGATLTFTFEDGIEESFVLHGGVLPEQVFCDLEQAQERIRRAVAAHDIRTLSVLDPFFEDPSDDASSAPSPARAGEAAGPLARSIGGIFRLPVMFGLAAALGVVLAAPLWYARNLRSDEAMFRRATREDTERAFEAYLVSGRRHAEEVRTSLLPRAALKEAERKGSVTALRQFLAMYPKSCVDSEARAKIHALFLRMFGEFREQASAADPRLLPFMERLVGYLEAHESSRIEARFHSPSSSALAVVDAVLERKAERAGIGRIVPVAAHFDDLHSIPRESSIVRSLQAGFAAVFPADVMTIGVGQRLVAHPLPLSVLLGKKPTPEVPANGTPAPEPPHLPPPAIEVPTLDVQYKVAWAGDLYSEEKGNRQFVGIVIYFDVSMRIPGQPESFDFSFEVTPPDHFSVDYFSTGDPLFGLRGATNPNAQAPLASPPEGQVYDAMAERAFDQLTDKLRAVFFRPGSRAFEERNIDDPADGPRSLGRPGPNPRPVEPPRRRGIHL